MPEEQTPNTTDVGPIAIGGPLGLGAVAAVGAYMLKGHHDKNAFTPTSNPINSMTDPFGNLSRKTLSNVTYQPFQLSSFDTGRYNVNAVAGSIAKYDSSRYAQELHMQQSAAAQLGNLFHMNPAFGSGISVLSSQHGDITGIPQIATYNMMRDASNLAKKKHIALDIETSFVKGGKTFFSEFSHIKYTPEAIRGMSFDAARSSLISGNQYGSAVFLNELMMSRGSKFVGLHGSYSPGSAMAKAKLLSKFTKPELMDLARIAGFQNKAGAFSYLPDKDLTKMAFGKGKMSLSNANKWAAAYDRVLAGAGVMKQMAGSLSSSGSTIKATGYAGASVDIMMESSAKSYISNFLSSNPDDILVGHGMAYDKKYLEEVTGNKILNSISDTLHIGTMEMGQPGHVLKKRGINKTYSKRLPDLIHSHGIKSNDPRLYHQSLYDTLATTILHESQNANAIKHGAPIVRRKTYSPGDMFLITGHYNTQHTGVASLDQAVDKYFLGKGHIFSIENIHEMISGAEQLPSGVKPYKIDFQQYGVESGQLIKTRKSHAIFNSMEDIQNLLADSSVRFGNVNRNITESVVQEAKEVSEIRGINKAFDIIAQAIGVNGMAASNERVDFLRKVATSPGPVDVNPDMMEHYIKTSSFTGTIKDFVNSPVGKTYDDIRKQLSSRPSSEIDAILGLTHKELGLGMKDIFLQSERAANRFNKEIPIPDEVLDRFGIKGMSSIRMGNITQATSDMNTLLGKMRGASRKDTEELGATVIRDLLGMKKMVKGKNNTIISADSALGKILGQLHDGKALIDNINKYHAGKFRQIHSDSTNVGELIASAILSSAKKLKISYNTKVLSPQFASSGLGKTITDKAIEISNRTSTLGSADQLFDAISGTIAKTRQHSASTIESAKKAIEVSDAQGKLFANNVWDLYTRMKLDLGAGDVMLRVADEGRQVHIGVITNKGLAAKQAFWQGEEAEGLHNLIIPVQGKTIQMGSRTLESKTFAGTPAGYKPLAGMKQDYYTPGDLQLMKFGSTSDEGFIEKAKKQIYNIKKHAKNLEQAKLTRDEAKIADAQHGYIMAQDSFNKSINHVHNSMVELLSSSADTDWLTKTAGIDPHDIAEYSAPQSGSLGAQIAGGKIHHDMEGKLGVDLLNKAEEISGSAALKPGNEGVLYGRPQHKGRGDVISHDINKIFPYVNNPQSPRGQQMLNNMTVQIKDGFTDMFGATSTMQAMEAEGKRLVKDARYDRQAVPTMGLKVIPEEQGMFNKIAKRITGKDYMLSIEEGSSIFSSTFSERVMTRREIEKSVASTLLTNVKSKPLAVGDFVEHGYQLGADKVGNAIFFKHPLEMSSSQMHKHMKNLGVNLGINEYKAQVTHVEELLGGGRRYSISVPHPVLPGTPLYHQNTKNIAGIVEQSFFTSGLGLNKIFEQLVSHKEQSSKSRNNIGAMIENYANVSSAILQHKEVAEEVTRLYGTHHKGLTVDDVRREASEIHQLLQVKWNPGDKTATLPDKLTLTSGKELEESIKILKQVESKKIAQYIPYTTPGGEKMVIGLQAANVSVSGELPVGRTQGVNHNKFYQGVGRTPAETEIMRMVGLGHTADAITQNMDRSAVEAAQSSFEALSSLRETSKKTLHDMSDFDRAMRQPGATINTEGTLLQHIDNLGGMHVKLPVSGKISLDKLPGQGSKGSYKDIDSIFLPKMNLHHEGAVARDKYAGLVANLYDIHKNLAELGPDRAQDKMTSLLEQFRQMMHEDVIGKTSTVTNAMRSYDPISAMMTMAPTGGANNMNVVMNPETIKSMYGQQSIDILNHFQNKGDPFLVPMGRYPTTFSTSHGVAKLEANEMASPWEIYTGAGNWKLMRGDHDRDLGSVLSAYGVTPERLKGVKTQKDIELLHQEVVASKGYKEQLKLFNARQKIADQVGQEVHSEYTAGKGGAERMAAEMNAQNVPSYMLETRENVQNMMLYNYNSPNMTAAQRERYVSSITKSQLGTTAVTGEVSNMSSAIQQMSMEVFGASQINETLQKQHLLTYDFAGALYQSSLSSKTTGQVPAVMFQDIFGKNKHSTTEELEGLFRTGLKEHGIYDDFMKEIGEKHFEGGSQAAAQIGEEATSTTFRMFDAFTSLKGAEMGIEGRVTPVEYKSQLDRLMSRKHITAANKVTTNELLDMIKAGAKGNSDHAAIFNKMAGVQQEVEQGIVSLARPRVSRGLAIAGTVGAAAIGAWALSGAARGTPKAPNNAQVPLQELGQYDTMNGAPKASYETTYINVHGKSNRHHEGLDSATMATLQSAIPVSLTGSLNFNDNRRSTDDIVNRALMNIL